MEILRVEDVVVVPAGVWHWHGARLGHFACHLSIRVPGPTDWSVPRRDWEDRPWEI